MQVAYVAIVNQKIKLVFMSLFMTCLNHSLDMYSNWTTALKLNFKDVIFKFMIYSKSITHNDVLHNWQDK